MHYSPINTVHDTTHVANCHTASQEDGSLTDREERMRQRHGWGEETLRVRYALLRETHRRLWRSSLNSRTEQLPLMI